MARVFLILGKQKVYSRHFTVGKWLRNSKKWEVFLVLSLENSFSSLRILIPSDENYFPSLGISFSPDGIYISSDVFYILSRDFFTKVRSFRLKEGKSRKNKPIFYENIRKLRILKALRIDYFQPTLLELQMAC